MRDPAVEAAYAAMKTAITGMKPAHATMEPAAPESAAPD
jgi:hypothetical protein